jgi:peptide/nickel transport system substrate-binding protein
MGQGATQGVAAPAKRITIGMLSEPPTVWDITGGRGIVPGIAFLQGLVSAGLTVKDETGALRPQLAEAVPSVDNGLWKVLPSGEMETTWRIREGARWQDGTPFTTADLLFTIRVSDDRELAVFRHAAFDIIENVEAVDTRTILVRWKRPYIGADRMFSLGSEGYAWPMPEHLLGPGFTENRSAFLQQPYWNTDFMGNGPFKLREWSPGSHALLDAYPEFALGQWPTSWRAPSTSPPNAA